MKLGSIGVAVLAMVAASPLSAQTDKTPNLATTVPAAWSVDRFAPAQFDLANGVQGRNNVLEIGVVPTDHQSDPFYNYQGMQIGIDPVGTVPSGMQKLVLDLFVNSSWRSNADGNVSTSMWSRVNQVATDDESAAWYPILGFTNENGGGEFRYWNSTLGWQDLAAVVNYNAWNTLEIDYTGNVFTAFVNGSLQYTETADAGTERLTTAFVQDKNFGDVAYTADWSNHADATTATPEPASLALMGTGLFGLGAYARRRKARNVA